MKCVCWLVLAMTAYGSLRAQDFPGVRLIATRSQTHATLSWPLPDSKFVLESATSFDSTDWQSVTEVITITDGYCEVAVPLDHGERYFRLRSEGGFSRSGEGASVPAVTNGYITAVLRCSSVPRPPPPLGEIAVGGTFVIMTVARGDPMDYQRAQQIVTDAVFESLMPVYCGMSVCGATRVQWNIVTYDAAGNPRISGGPVSGSGFHYCPVTNGYVTAVIRGESAVLPAPPPVGQVAVGADSVIMTIADGDPMDLGAAQGLATEAVFESLMRRYCALPRGTGSGYVSGRAQWIVSTFDTEGNLERSGCATSGCDFHECVASRGYITATLRSECTSAPRTPPPVGGIIVGPDYVMMTVADGDPLDYQTAQQFATDAVFQSLMPLYCALAEGPRSAGCPTNRVQWNLLAYDAGGNPKLSGSPTSGPGFHYFGPCSLTPEERIQNLIVWVEVDVAAGILNSGSGQRLTARLNAALRELARGNTQKAIGSVKRFLRDVGTMVGAERLPTAAAQALIDGALATVAQLEGEARLSGVD